MTFNAHQAPPRRFLLLQGLQGPFFQSLGSALRKAGHCVWKVNFNGGDWLFWRLGGNIEYRGNEKRWRFHCRQIIKRHHITDVVLFGDCRPLHRIAVKLCKQMGVRVHVFEEGYIRPDWVTLENHGVNANSSLPRDPAWYLQEAAKLPPRRAHHRVPSSFLRRALEGVAYNTADLVTRPLYPGWKDYRPWHPLQEGVGWLRRLSRRKKVQQQSEKVFDHLSAGMPYMLFPLQLDADAQIRLHSGFTGMTPAIEQVIRSFASYAPTHMHLVIKEHPLDNGLRNWENIIQDVARQHHVEGRVHFMGIGDIERLVTGAEGVVTVNSTVGTLALHRGIPVHAMGRAVYAIKDITHQGALDGFWRNPPKPDPQTWAAFKRVLIQRALISGGFFSDEGLQKLCRSAIARMTAPEQMDEPELLLPQPTDATD
ncbi:capsule biosynthesis protein [Formicincola oecophyllae]|uniref:capsule biosynthesis protein n=1 Tax=Formicincola oecophyllae TaxID=2558361 RepID=UPI001F0F5757|nr:capsular biosynthesis protein [Formicincola oecophyllae]